MTETIYSFAFNDLHGTPHRLSDYQGKVLLIVNTASRCGFTPQYAGLEHLHREFADRGLVVIGFPCNQFGAQEPGNATDIQHFCEKNYGVSFVLSDKIEVNGPNAHPLFQYLQTARPGWFGTGRIKWNFTKFLIGRDGRVIDRFAPMTSPESLRDAITSALASG